MYPADIHAVAPAKLREIFAADAALYMEVDKYGTRYIVIDSVTEVSVAAKLLDLRSGAGTLWENRVDFALSTRGSNQGLLGALVSAVVNQIANTVRDNGYPVSKQAMRLLLQSGDNALIPGARLEDRRE